MSIEKLDFSRITKDSLPYTVFLNSIIQNINNADSLAVYVYLYSLPTDWKINKQHLSNKFKLGDKKLRSVFSYLHRANLLEYHQIKDSVTGKMKGTTIHLLNGEKFDKNVEFSSKKTSEAKIACVVKTEAAISDPVVFRPCGSDGLQKKEINKENKNNETNTSTDEKIDLPVWLSDNSWQEFKQHRKEIKKPLTPLAEKKSLKSLTKLKDMGQDPHAVIDQSIENGWAGFFEIKKSFQKKEHSITRTIREAKEACRTKEDKDFMFMLS